MATTLGDTRVMHGRRRHCPEEHRFPGQRTAAVTARPLNRLLASLPPADLARIRPRLRTIGVEVGHVFFHAAQRIDKVVFLHNGVGSVTAALDDGRTVELATVGDEGFMGTDAVFSDDASALQSVLHVPSPHGPTVAEEMPLADFRREYQGGGAFRDAINRYMQGFSSLLMRSAPCFKFHGVQERAARWLLLTHDRAHADDFRLSQEFLALMLGSSRPVVTMAACALRSAGLIDYAYGRITIRDRAGLEAASCECYAAVKADFDRLGL